MIDWNKYFDHIYIHSCTTNFDCRKNLNKELKRIGCKKYEYYYSPKEYTILNYDHFSKGMKNPHKDVTFGEYLLIKIAYELGYENILLMEDDIHFLKDIYEIENQLNIFLENKDKCNFYFFDYVIYDAFIYNFSCIYLDRKAMKYIIYCVEHFPLIIDNYIVTDYLYPNNYMFAEIEYTLNYETHKINIYNNDNINIFPINVILAPKRLCIQEDIQNSYFKLNQREEYKLNNIEEYNL